MKKTYKQLKNRARHTAQGWQEKISDVSLSWGELLEAQNYFYLLGKRYGLIKEFRQEGII